MLKWAVSGSRQAYLQDENEKLALSRTSNAAIQQQQQQQQQQEEQQQQQQQQQQRRRLKCKSLNICDEGNNMKRKTSWGGKENRCTSTPLHSSKHIYIESPSSKMGSLKDLSNIIAETSEFVRKSPLAVKDFNKDMPSNYASTLPTFDVEYSPCALISGQILALRGVGVPDSYFGKPRYLSSQLEAKDLSQLGEEALEIKSICQNDKSKNPTLSKTNLLSGAIKEDSSLSSSKMGDITLEHMIDAILESTLKEKKLPKYSKHSQSHHHQQQQQHQHQQQQQQQLSPTYTPGDDPASDLHEVWDSNELRYRQKEQKHMNRFSRKRLFNETQINNPQQTTFSPDIDTIKLKRQRVVRRKRKITQITDSIINSAHKLLGKSNPSTDTITITACVAPSCVTEVYDTEIVSNDDPPSKKSRNISSDSGHNSSNGEFDDGGDKSETIFDNKVLTKDVERQVCDSAKRQLTFPVI